MKLEELTKLIEECLLEIKVSDENTRKLVNEFGELSDQIDTLAATLKEIKKRYSEIEAKLLVLLNELEETGDRALITEKCIVTLKRQGYTRDNVSYQKAFEEALVRVNGAIKTTLKTILAETKTTTTIAPSIGVQRLKEQEVSANIQKIDQQQSVIDKANNLLLKMAAGELEPDTD